VKCLRANMGLSERKPLTLGFFLIVWGFSRHCISRVGFKGGGGLILWAIVRYSIYGNEGYMGDRVC